MITISPKELLKAGVHFGHCASRWNPKMKPYIFGKRNAIHIIDLKETIKGLVRAYHFLSRVVSQGKKVLFVGTKRPARNVIETEAKRCGMPYAAEKWIGGTLTNFSVVRARLKRLLELEEMEKDSSMDSLGKKIKSVLQREKKKLKKNLDGLRNMDK